MIRPLSQTDDPSGFSCGSTELDRYLVRYALHNAAAGVSVTYVHLNEADAITGYVTLAATSVRSAEVSALSDLPAYPLPALLVARLAVDKTAQGAGIGRRLLASAMEEAVVLHSRTGCIGVMVDAKPGAERFYERFGFRSVNFATPRPRPTRMFLEIGTVLDSLG